MIRPLYLDAGMNWSVCLEEGAVLKISAPGRARSLFPLNRLARVLSPAHAEWSTQALLACLKAGVPVVFHDSKGEALGWCFGPRRRETSLGNLLRLAIDHPDGIAELSTWRQSAESREIIAALSQARALTCRVDASSARARLCNLHRIRLGLPIGPYLRAVERSVSAMVSENLHDAVGDPSLIGFAAEGLNLSAVLTALLEWQMHRALLGVGRKLVETSTPARFAAAEMERSGNRFHQAVGALVGDLERHLRERFL